MKNLPILLLLTGLIFASVSCLKTPSLGKPKQDDSLAAASGPPVSVEWKQVGDQPATFFPERLDANAETTAEDGEWFDRGGVRYFVPVHGIGEAKYADVVRSIPAAPRGSKIRSEKPESSGEEQPKKLFSHRPRSQNAGANVRTDSIWKTEL